MSGRTKRAKIRVMPSDAAAPEKYSLVSLIPFSVFSETILSFSGRDFLS